MQQICHFAGERSTLGRTLGGQLQKMAEAFLRRAHAHRSPKTE